MHRIQDYILIGKDLLYSALRKCSFASLKYCFSLAKEQ